MHTLFLISYNTSVRNPHLVQIFLDMYNTPSSCSRSIHTTLLNSDKILHLESKIKSVNQTVHDNRKKIIKEILWYCMGIRWRGSINALRRLKICDPLVLEFACKADDVSLSVDRAWIVIIETMDTTFRCVILKLRTSSVLVWLESVEMLISHYCISARLAE